MPSKKEQREAYIAEWKAKGYTGAYVPLALRDDPEPAEGDGLKVVTYYLVRDGEILVFGVIDKVLFDDGGLPLVTDLILRSRLQYGDPVERGDVLDFRPPYGRWVRTEPQIDPPSSSGRFMATYDANGLLDDRQPVPLPDEPNGWDRLPDY